MIYTKKLKTVIYKVLSIILLTISHLKKEIQKFYFELIVFLLIVFLVVFVYFLLFPK